MIVKNICNISIDFTELETVATSLKHTHTHTHTNTHTTVFYLDYPGEPVPERQNH